MAGLVRTSFLSNIQPLRGTRAKGPRPHFMELEYLPKNYLWEEPPTPLVFDPITKWTQESVRCGVLAQKVRMTHVWDEWLNFIALTVIKVPNCQVIQHKTKEKEGYDAIQVGSGERRAKNVKKPVLGHLLKAGVPPKMKIAEFRITPDAFIPVGTQLHVNHFTPGQKLDITGLSKGKGFAGVMKRWGFSGGRASHGASLSHRSLGSTGQRQDPGKVFKNKKMPGRMGHVRSTIKNLTLYMINPKENLMYVRGSVPGAPNTWLLVKDAKNKKFTQIPPFPNAPPPEIPDDYFSKVDPSASDRHVVDEEHVLKQVNPRPEWWIDDNINFDLRRVVKMEQAKLRDTSRIETKAKEKEKRDLAKEKIKKIKREEKKQKAKEAFETMYANHMRALDEKAARKSGKPQDKGDNDA